MGISDLLPEGIPGPAALLYSIGPGYFGRPAQRKIAEAVDEALPADARFVLDLGCGPGWLSVELARRRPGLRVVAVDLSSGMARIARFTTRRLPTVDVRRENGARMSQPDASVDMVVSAESMHHWREPVAVLSEIHRVLKPGGRAWVFDGRDDFEAGDLGGWTPFGDSPPPRVGILVMRAVLRAHGFTQEQWRTRVPELARCSHFGTATIEPFGIYRRMELVKAPSPARP